MLPINICHLTLLFLVSLSQGSTLQTTCPVLFPNLQLILSSFSASLLPPRVKFRHPSKISEGTLASTVNLLWSFLSHSWHRGSALTGRTYSGFPKLVLNIPTSYFDGHSSFSHDLPSLDSSSLSGFLESLWYSFLPPPRSLLLDHSPQWFHSGLNSPSIQKLYHSFGT